MKKSSKGNSGISGPTGITFFELKNGVWTTEYAELNNLCIPIHNFLCKHPELAGMITITKEKIQSTLSNNS